MRKALIKKASDSPEVYTINLRGADDEDLVQISGEMGLALSLAEMKALKKRFAKAPTDVELQTFGQTWSEHCIHKTFRGDVVTERGVVSNLLKSYIAKATNELNKPWCFSVFEDNAGLVEFDKCTVAAAKVETHNHPSAVEPFGGAATGVGGVIRDILGVWGEPIAVSDVLCFGPLDTKQEELPPGVKHPKYIYKGVVAGVGSYGNNMGLPTVSGAVIFDRQYTGNVIVYCGAFGVLPKEKYIKDTREGDLAVLAGGKTGRDGIHGVTFASADLSEEAESLRSAVQIPNPLVEERLRRATLRIRDGRLATGVTDLGGGGVSCATGEMAYRSGLGLTVDIGKMHLKEPDLAPWEIWVSESQERMLYSVPEEKFGSVSEILEEEEIEYCVLGRFDKSGRLRVVMGEKVVCDLDLETLYSPPKITRKAKEEVYHPKRVELEEPKDLEGEILALLSEPNLRSRESVIRTYDHEVRAATAIKPLQGPEGGPNDAAVLKPLSDSWMGLVISCGLNPFLPDAYWMAAASIEEAVRNNVAVGGRRVAILDNFVWGNPEKEDRMGSLLRACEACYDFSKALDVPFISGKDSLYNESPLGPVRPTLLITGIGIIPDVRKAVTTELKGEGNPVYAIGMTKDELGGSAYYRSKGLDGGEVPKANGPMAKAVMSALTTSMDMGIVRSCHDVSEGGIGLAAAEMAISSPRRGIKMDLKRIPSQTKRSDSIIFSESTGRFLVEADAGRAEEFDKIFYGLPVAKIGEVVDGSRLAFMDMGGKEYSIDSKRLRLAWRGY